MLMFISIMKLVVFFLLLFFLFKSYISIYKHTLNNAPPPEKSRQLLMEKHMVGY